MGADEKITAVANELLKRPLSKEEELELYRVADILGMKDVQSFLHQLLVFKLHENTMNERFSEMMALEKQLESTVERILGEGAARIGAGMGEAIAERAKEVMTSVEEFHFAKGLIIASSVTGIMTTLAYWSGLSGAFIMDDINGLSRGVLLMPAGWWMFVSVAAYTYFWCFDNWNMVKTSTFHQCLLGFQTVIMLILILSML